MRDKNTFQSKGRTGREGASFKLCGMLAAAAGLVWTFMAFTFSEGMVALVAPLCFLIAGAGVFYAGHQVARSAACRGSAS